MKKEKILKYLKHIEDTLRKEINIKDEEKKKLEDLSYSIQKYIYKKEDFKCPLGK